MTVFVHEDIQFGRSVGHHAATMRPTPGDLLDPAIPPDTDEDSFLRGYYESLSEDIGRMSSAASRRMINKYRRENNLPLLPE